MVRVPSTIPQSSPSIPPGRVDGELHLVHTFEGKQLVQEYIANTMMGIEYLWGRPVHLETSEAEVAAASGGKAEQQQEISWDRVVYSMTEKVLSKRKI